MKIRSLLFITLLSFAEAGAAQNATEFDAVKSKCASGDSESCLSAAMTYQYDREHISLAEAAKYYEKACNLNNGQGCAQLGVLYESGSGVAKSFDKSLELYKKSCSMRNAFGCELTGNSYLGMVKDNSDKKAKQAADFYKKACDLKDGFGCSKLAELYGKGIGVQKSVPHRVKYLTLACESAETQKCEVLAAIYEKGSGVKQSYKLAAKYYRRGCEEGTYGQACLGLASLYRDGKGVTQDLTKAEEFLKKACDNGVQSACKP